MKNLKFFDKYYVGFQKDRYDLKEEQKMLGFATPIEDNTNYEKRKDTVDRWRDEKIEPVEFENKPIFGFKIKDVINRSMTDNKVYRIEDPRGFELEISSYNLFDLIENHTLVKGDIMEPLVWARDGAKNYLISGTSEEYKQHLSPKKEQPADVLGHYFIHKANPNVIYRYEGKYFYTSVKRQSQSYDVSRKNGYWSRYDMTYNKKLIVNVSEKQRVLIKYELNNNQKEQFSYVYTEFNLNGEGVLSYINVHLRKSKLKDLVYVGDTYDNEKIKEFKIPIKTSLNKYKETSGKGESIINKWKPNFFDYSSNFYYHDIFLFNTREEMKTFDISIQDLRTNFNDVEVLNLPDEHKNNKMYFEKYVNDELEEEADFSYKTNKYY